MQEGGEMSNHTPAPWVAVKHLHRNRKPSWGIHAARPVASTHAPVGDGHIVNIGDRNHGDDVEANAHLISAAPDLLKALSDLVERCEAGHDPHEELNLLIHAKSAISKATGKSLP